MGEEKPNRIQMIFWFLLYIISFFIRDQQSIMIVLGMYSIVKFFPFEKEINDRSECIASNSSSKIYVLVFIVFECFFSYYLRIYQRNLFDFGSITIFGIDIINSFVILIELTVVIFYYAWIQKKKIFHMNKKSCLMIGVILLPFIFGDSVTACYGVYIEKIEASTLTYLNLSYRAFILAALIEEIIYRGMIYDELKKYFPRLTAGIIQATIFTFVHSERWILYLTDFDFSILINLVVVFCMGIIAAMLRERTNSVVPGIVMHGALNGGIYNFIVAIASIN